MTTERKPHDVSSVPHGCKHEWQRAPDRDLISTPLDGGGTLDIVFWCPKCGTAKTERINFPYRDGRP